MQMWYVVCGDFGWEMVRRECEMESEYRGINIAPRWLTTGEAVLPVLQDCQCICTLSIGCPVPIASHPRQSYLPTHHNWSVARIMFAHLPPVHHLTDPSNLHPQFIAPVASHATPISHAPLTFNGFKCIATLACHSKTYAPRPSTHSNS